MCPVDSRSTEILVDSGEAASGSVVRILRSDEVVSRGDFTFLNLSINRRFDDRLLLLFGTADNLALDGYAPTVLSNLDVNVFLANARQLSFDDVRVALLRNVDGRAQSIPSQSEEWVVEYRVASANVGSLRGPAKERVLEHSEEWTEFAEEVAAERHFTASGDECPGLS